MAQADLLVTLLVKIAVIASMASISLRWNFAKRMFLREQRTIRQRFELSALFGAVFAAGTLVRVVLGYRAAEVGLEGAFVSGLVGGYVTGSVAGAVIALPAFLSPGFEWPALPLLAGVGALGGLLRALSPGPEEVWRFSPFFPFTLWSWTRARIPHSQGAFQLLLLTGCLSIEFIRTNLAHAFEERGRLFAPYPQDAELNPLTVALVYCATAVCVGLTLKVWNNTRNEWKLEEQQRLLIEARLLNLTSQINPHFLFNTLNSVASLIRIDQDQARQTVFRLSTILRRLLRKHDAFSPLRDELAFIDDYLQIEQVRFGDKLRIEKDVAPETLETLIPSMILQPIVENSIKHGIGPKVEGGTIRLRSGLRGGRLQIEVEDDGIGIPEDVMLHVFHKGIGFSNVHERLSVLFGNDFHLTVEHREGGGVRVRVQIPRLQDPDASGAPAFEPAKTG